MTREESRKLPFRVERGIAGCASAIMQGDWVVLHLVAGTERNEEEVEGVVGLLNTVRDYLSQCGPRAHSRGCSCGGWDRDGELPCGTVEDRMRMLLDMGRMWEKHQQANRECEA